MSEESYKRVYDAAEERFDVDELNASDIYDWLTKRSGRGTIRNGFDRAGNQRKADSGVTAVGQSKLRGLAVDMARGKAVYEQVKKLEIDNSSPAESEDTLNDLLAQARDLPVHSQSVVNEINPKIEQANDTALNIAEVQEQISAFNERVNEIKSKDIEEQKRLYKEGSAEDRRLAAVALREDSPQTLGGLVRWNGKTNRDKQAITNAINSIF